MAKKKLKVQGLTIRIEPVNNDDYISLTDIAKQSEKSRPGILISSWMKNSSTLEYLEAWERMHNPNFKSNHLDAFKIEAMKNRTIIRPQKWIEDTGAIGLKSKKGRTGGGTWGHPDLAFNFCYWLSPTFQLYVAKEFQRLKQEEFSHKNLEWHLSKITNNIDEVRNLLDTIPGQLPELNRLNSPEEQED